MYSQEHIQKHIKEIELQKILKEIEPLLENKKKAENTELQQRLNIVLYWTISDRSYDKKSKFEIIEKLIAAGANINSVINIKFDYDPHHHDEQREYDSTPLQAALILIREQGIGTQPDTDLLEFLITQGADINFYRSGKAQGYSYKQFSDHVFYEICHKPNLYGHYIQYFLENPKFNIEQYMIEKTFVDFVEKELKNKLNEDIYDLADENSKQSLAPYIDLFVHKFIQNPELINSEIRENLIKYFRHELRKVFLSPNEKSKVADLLKKFSKLNININSEDANHRTFMHELCTDGNLLEVNEAINMGADLNSIDFYNKSPFQYAINREQFAIADLILKKRGVLSPEDQNAIIENITAIFSDNSINTSDKINKIYPHLRYLSFLKLEKKYTDDLNLDNSDLNLAKLLSEPEIGAVVLSAACVVGNVDLVSELIKQSAKDSRDPGGSALHKAVAGKNIKIVQLLLDNKSDPNLQNQNGETPLHIAIEKGNVEIVKLLLNAGASYAIPDKKGKTPLAYAFGDKKFNSYTTTDPESYKNFIKELQLLHQLGLTMLRWSIETEVRIGPHILGLSSVDQTTLKNSFFQSYQGFANDNFDTIKKAILEQFSATDEEIEIIIKQVFEIISHADLSEISELPKSSLPPLYALEYSTSFADGRHLESLIVLNDVEHNTAEVLRCNRGAGSGHRTGVEINQVLNLNRLQNLPDFVKGSSLGSIPDSENLNKELEKKLGLERMKVLGMQDQRVGNCRWMTRKTMLFGTIYSAIKLFLIQKNRVNPDSIESLAYLAASKWYKSLTIQDRFDQVKNLVNLLPEQPIKLMPPVIKNTLLEIYERAVQKEKYKPIADFLKERGIETLFSYTKLLREGINKHQKTFVEAALKFGVDANFAHSYEQNKKPITLLSAAIERAAMRDPSIAPANENIEIIRLLLDAGARLNEGNPRPLLLASAYGNSEIIQLLINAGSNPLTEAEKQKMDFYRKQLDYKIARENDLLDQAKSSALAWLSSREHQEQSADRKDSKEKQEVHKESQKVQKTQESQETPESQEKQTTQSTETTQPTKTRQTMQKAQTTQTMQEAQTTQTMQEAQATKDTNQNKRNTDPTSSP